MVKTSKHLMSLIGLWKAEHLERKWSTSLLWEWIYRSLSRVQTIIEILQCTVCLKRWITVVLACDSLREDQRFNWMREMQFSSNYRNADRKQKGRFRSVGEHLKKSLLDVLALHLCMWMLSIGIFFWDRTYSESSPPSCFFQNSNSSGNSFFDEKKQRKRTRLNRVRFPLLLWEWWNKLFFLLALATLSS